MRLVTAHNKSTVYINAGWIYPAERAAVTEEPRPDKGR